MFATGRPAQDSGRNTPRKSIRSRFRTDGDGFEAVFEHFVVKHLPDLRRTKWLEMNAPNGE